MKLDKTLISNYTKIIDNMRLLFFLQVCILCQITIEIIVFMVYLASGFFCKKKDSVVEIGSNNKASPFFELSNKEMREGKVRARNFGSNK